jgi:hypothetical protein
VSTNARWYRALPALALAIGCRDVLGIETRSEGPPLLVLSDRCLECVESACASLERACAADPDCAAMATCVASHTDDPAGRAACEEAAPGAASAPAYLALDACMRSPCQDDCTGIKGLLAGRSESCDSCLVTACETEIRACVAQRSCERSTTAAFTGAMTPPKAILFDSAPGIEGTPMRALDDCIGGDTCVPECGIDGSDFTCARTFEWPGAEVASASLEVLVRSFPADLPIPGIVVQACEPLSDPCTPIESASTDRDGLATLTIPIPLQPYPFRGYARVFDPSAEPSFLDTNYFFGRPFYGAASVSTKVFGEATLVLAANLVDTTPKAGRAQITMLFLDCNNRLADGVELAHDASLLADADSKIGYYPKGDVPPTKDGLVNILNAAPGCHEVRGLVGPDEIYGTTFFAAPDVITIVPVYPRSSDDDPGYVCTP